MCNLYDLGRARHLDRDEWEKAVAEVVREIDASLTGEETIDATPRPKLFGARKTDPGLVLVNTEGTPRPIVMRWGFHRPYNPAVNNARSEKLETTWSLPWREKKKCLIPISTFYEWQGGTGAKQTFAIEAPERGTLLWAAGLWEETPKEAGPLSRSFSMITRESRGPVSKIHHRMPALLEPSGFEAFLLSDDPHSVLGDSHPDLVVYRCENPLKHPTTHEGPVREDFLPGFE